MVDQLFNFRNAKFSIFMEVGNIDDINNMSMKDFTNLSRYVDRKHKIETGKPIPLRESNKNMIKMAKMRNKYGKSNHIN